MKLINADDIKYQMLYKENFLSGTGVEAQAVWKSDIDSMPAVDAVPVVRCKDCRWWDQINDGPYGYCHACKHAFYSSSWEINIYRRYKADWFCADGEKDDD